MDEKARKTRAAYFREWRKKNPGKNKEYIERYWERKAKELEKEEEENNSNG